MTRIKDREIAEACQFKHEASAWEYVARLAKKGVITKHELGLRRYAYTVNKPVRVVKKIEPLFGNGLKTQYTSDTTQNLSNMTHSAIMDAKKPKDYFSLQFRLTRSGSETQIANLSLGKFPMANIEKAINLVMEQVREVFDERD